MGTSSSTPASVKYFDGCQAVSRNMPLPVCMDNPDIGAPKTRPTQVPHATTGAGDKTCLFFGCKQVSKPLLQVKYGCCMVRLAFFPVPTEALRKLDLMYMLKIGRLSSLISTLRFCEEHQRIFWSQFQQAIQRTLGDAAAQQLGDFLVKQVIHVYGGALGYDGESTELWQEAIEAECA